MRIVSIGPDNDFEVHEKRGLIKGNSLKVILRYGQPIIKTLIQEWSDSCGTEIDDGLWLAKCRRIRIVCRNSERSSTDNTESLDDF